MRSEGKKEHGHLQICTNILQELCELHAHLIKSAAKFPYYREMYYKVLPYIVELRGKIKIVLTRAYKLKPTTNQNFRPASTSFTA